MKSLQYHDNIVLSLYTSSDHTLLYSCLVCKIWNWLLKHSWKEKEQLYHSGVVSMTAQPPCCRVSGSKGTGLASTGRCFFHPLGVVESQMANVDCVAKQLPAERSITASQWTGNAFHSYKLRSQMISACLQLWMHYMFRILASFQSH